MGSQRTVLWRKQLQLPSQCQEACENNTAESFSEFFDAAESEKCVENLKSQRQESQWKNVLMIFQGYGRKVKINSLVSGRKLNFKLRSQSLKFSFWAETKL